MKIIIEVENLERKTKNSGEMNLEIDKFVVECLTVLVLALETQKELLALFAKGRYPRLHLPPAADIIADRLSEPQRGTTVYYSGRIYVEALH